MKRLFSYLAVFVASVALLSCSTLENRAQKVALKVLTDVGNGVYRGEYIGNSYFNDALMKSPYIEDYSIENHKAFVFREKSEPKNDKYNILLRIYFNTDDYLFNDIKLVKSSFEKEDIYHTYFPSLYSDDFIEKYHGGKEAFLRTCNQLMETYRNEPGFKSIGIDYIYIEYKDTPIYTFTYKLDNMYIANVEVACVKGKKPVVISIKHQY